MRWGGMLFKVSLTPNKGTPEKPNPWGDDFHNPPTNRYPWAVARLQKVGSGGIYNKVCLATSGGAGRNLSPRVYISHPQTRVSNWEVPGSSPVRFNFGFWYFLLFFGFVLFCVALRRQLALLFRRKCVVLYVILRPYDAR